MKNLLALAFCLCLAVAATAQLNSDTSRSSAKKPKTDHRRSAVYDHMNPKFPNYADPQGKGYDMDGAVFGRESIINRHATSLNQMIR